MKKRSDQILCSFGCALPESVHHGATYVCKLLGSVSTLCEAHRDEKSCCRKMTSKEVAYFSSEKAWKDGVWLLPDKASVKRKSVSRAERHVQEEKPKYVKIPKETDHA